MFYNLVSVCSKQPKINKILEEDGELQAAGPGFTDYTRDTDGGFREYLSTRHKKPKRTLNYLTLDAPPPSYETATKDKGLSKEGELGDKTIQNRGMNMYPSGEPSTVGTERNRVFVSTSLSL